MPVYQYACTECGEQLEVRQSFTDAALTECPACEGRLRKVLNAVGVVFKGSGFYRNDSRAAANGGSSAADGASAAKAGDPTPSSAPGRGDKSEKGEKGEKAPKKDSSSGSATKDSAAKPAPAATH